MINKSGVLKSKLAACCINSILAVIYLTKLQTLINRLVMNCSMNIFVYMLYILAVIYVNHKFQKCNL